jgi:hypothetical protein
MQVSVDENYPDAVREVVARVLDLYREVVGVEGVEPEVEGG